MAEDSRVPEGMTPEALRTIADWLDTYDRMGEAFADACERSGIGTPKTVIAVRAAVTGTEVQDDLRRWADELDAS